MSQFGRGQSTLLTGAGMLTTNSDEDIRESNSQHLVSHERDLSVDGFQRSAKKHWEPNPFSSGGIRVKKQLREGLTVIYSYNNYN